MLTTIEGIYENGQVIFNEIPPIQKKTKIFITFLGEIEKKPLLTKRPLGTMKGTIKMSANFNEPIDDLKD